MSNLKANNMINLNPIQDVANLIGDVCNDLNLIRDTSINIDVDDFVQTAHKVTFAAIKNIAIQSPLAESVSARDIDNYLSAFEGKHKKWLEQKGFEYVQQCIEKANADTFDLSYKRVKKMSLLRAYTNEGIDITDIYNYQSLDMQEVDNDMQTIDNMEMRDIIDHFSVKQLRVKDRFNVDSDVESFEAGSNLDDLFARLSKGPDYGLPFDNAYYNALFRGMKEGKLLLQSAESGGGKAIAYGTKIPTPNGWDVVENIKVGDKLFDKNGKETNVVGVYPQGIQNVYRVTLNDGRYVDCNLEHLWEVYTRSDVKYVWDTKDMIKYLEERPKERLKIKKNSAVEYPEKDLLLDPYVLGVILGDGCVSEGNERFTISSGNDDVPNEVGKRLGLKPFSNKWNCSYNYELPKDHTYDISQNGRSRRWLHNKDIKRELQGLFGKKSDSKFIPKEYLTASIEQRQLLLQGLMDTDGSISFKKGGRQGALEYCTKSKQLSEDFRELAFSLGYETRVVFSERDKCYYIHISIPSVQYKEMFLAESEKLEKAITMSKHKDYKRHEFVGIKSIEKMNFKKEQVCFTVDNSEHLFLIGDYVVTHNTRNAIRDVCTVSIGKKYNIQKQVWEEQPIQRPSLLISTELEQDEVNILMLAYISGVPQDIIQNANYENEVFNRLQIAKQVLEEAPIYCTVIKDFSIQDIEDIIERHIIEKNIVVAAFDYIQMRPKLQRSLNEINGGMMQREDQVLQALAEALKYISERYNIFIRTSTQLSRNVNQTERKGQDALAGGRATANKVDFGVITTKATQKDIKSIEHILSHPKWGTIKPNYMHWVYKNRQNRDNLIVWTYNNLGNLREEICFITDYDFNLVDDILPEYLTYNNVETEEEEYSEIEYDETPEF